MEPRAKLWVEQDGKLVLSDYRVRLLELIDETGSLAEAAGRLQLLLPARVGQSARD